MAVDADELKRLSEIVDLTRELEKIESGCASLVKQIDEHPDAINALKAVRALAKSQATLAKALCSLIRKSVESPSGGTPDYLQSLNDLFGKKVV